MIGRDSLYQLIDNFTLFHFPGNLQIAREEYADPLHYLANGDKIFA